METILLQTAEEASHLAARIIAKLVRNKPDAVLGLATGSTPLGLYRELIRMHREEKLDFSRVTTFNLDEYVGLAPAHPASYHYFMQENLFRHLNIPAKSSHVPDGLTPGERIDTYCREYEEKIRAAGGLDLQVLGIGGDGHIGFNEPGSSLASRTRIKTLTERTMKDNAPFFSNPKEIPHHVITMGVGTIMEARQVVLLAFGEKKANAAAGAIEGPVTANLPASVLQFHPKATALLDAGAARELKRAEYYRWVYDNKPDWQRV